MSSRKIKLTLDQQQALWHLTESKQNVFVTGGAGTGKSFLIRHFLKMLPEKIPVLASTGAAAILVGGRTFHSYFGLGIMQGGAHVTLQNALQNKRLRKRLQKATTLIIDEVSMLSNETFDTAEKLARLIRGSDEPWGGIRILAVGDFGQLPPVGKGPLKEWAFLGEAWALSNFKTIQLKEVMRTEDEAFMRVLADLRLGRLSVRLKHYLQSRMGREPGQDATYLFPRRAQTDAFNRGRLNELDGESRVYETIYTGPQAFVERLKRDAPIADFVELKTGAFVMIRMNDPKQRFVNGTTGHIVDMREGMITIETETRRIELEKFSFGIQNEDGVEVATATNFPVSLAWASTIHKIQGATLGKMHVDLGGLWEPGQAYVALSRARRGDDVSISRWSESSIRADRMVMEFYGEDAGAEPLVDPQVEDTEYFSLVFKQD